ncbi:31616_t:CDS:2 [Gigaspora margarita]|uniref:31616_t:CDS:1 n=1 Tax=Gigaspora margarita TaxID=4874 RepID=A0ABN7UQA4_GIGMA|nr:31616_t:CDS:2 [Gigaspora margarita]
MPSQKLQEKVSNLMIPDLAKKKKGILKSKTGRKTKSDKEKSLCQNLYLLKMQEKRPRPTRTTC